jgi:hypothetical protein
MYSFQRTSDRWVWEESWSLSERTCPSRMIGGFPHLLILGIILAVSHGVVIGQLWPSGFSEAGYALFFDGADDHVRLNEPSLPVEIGYLKDAFSERTFSLWFRGASEGSEGTLYEEGGVAEGIAVRLAPFGLVEVGCSNYNVRTNISATVDDPTMWHHVAVVFDHGALRLFLDGSVSSSAAASYNIIDKHGSVTCVGATCEGNSFGLVTGEGSEATGDFFHGTIDEVRIWARARSEEEIAADYQRALEGGEPSLIGYWRFDEGTGQVLHDVTLDSHDRYRGSTPDPGADDPEWVLSDAPIGPAPTPTPTPWPFDVTLTAYIEPQEPYTLDDLECVTEVENLGGYPELFYFYRWLRDGEELTDPLEVGGEILPVTESILSHHYTVKNETFFCVARVTDGTGAVEAMTDPVTILNSPPSQPEIVILPEDPTPDDGLAVWFVVESEDPDGDLVLPVFEWFESSDGETWNRRTELSGSIDPYEKGEPEISSLYTQMAEYWQVVVTPVEFEAVGKPVEVMSAAELAALEVVQAGESALDDVYILPDLNGDDRVDGEDLLVLRSVWHKRKSELDTDLSPLFFEPKAAAESQVGASFLFLLGGNAWHTGGGN